MGSTCHKSRYLGVCRALAPSPPPKGQPLHLCKMLDLCVSLTLLLTHCQCHVDIFPLYPLVVIFLLEM